MSYFGLDVGTGFAKLARTRLARWLGPGGAPEVVTVQSALSYHGRGGLAIPVGSSADPRLAVRCDGFPALLGTERSTSGITEWQRRTPSGVTRDFLRCLFDETVPEDNDREGNADEGTGAESGLVVAVPPDAYASHTVSGRGAGAEITDALVTLGWPPKRLIAAPVAALLWLRYRNPGMAAARRVLLIDVGTGSADFCLCTVTRGSIRIVDSARVTGPTQEGALGPPDTITAGPPLTLVEHLVTSLAAASESSLQGQDRVRLWREFESALADEVVRDRMDAVLEYASALPKRHGNAIALRFSGLEVTASELLDAAEPLARQFATALGELLGRQEDADWRRFRPGADSAHLVVLLGGLTVLRPLRAALLSGLGLAPVSPQTTVSRQGQRNQSAGVLWPAAPDLTGAVARGAALLAAGLADPGDHYPHGLRLLVHRQVRTTLITEHLNLAAPGAISLELDQTEYLTRIDDLGAASPVTITVPSASAAGPPAAPGTAPLPVQVTRRDGTVAAAAFEPAPPPAPGAYWVAVRGGPQGPAVVLHPTDGGQPVIYSLAELADTVPDQPAPPQEAG